MLTAVVKSALKQIRDGTFDVAAAAPTFETLSARQFVDDLLDAYPFVFQRRERGRKREIGMARSVAYRLEFRKQRHAVLHRGYMLPWLERCFLVSAYDDRLSEITWIRRIYARPLAATERGLSLSFSRGYKLDRTIDGWVMQALPRTNAQLAHDLLVRRGWQFDALPPFGPKSAAWSA